MKQFSEKTLQNLKKYENLLQKWQRRINLIGPQTVSDVWRRHFEDSMQLWTYIPKSAKVLVDLGSGAGFPGLVLAIIAAEECPSLVVHLVESDSRKCVFMAEVARECGVSVRIHEERIEQMDGFPADVITARALKDVKTLLSYSRPFVAPQTTALFLKGERVQQEWRDVGNMVSADADFIPSQMDKSGIVLKLTQIRYQ